MAVGTTPGLWNVQNQPGGLMTVGKQSMYACTYACTHGYRNRRNPYGDHFSPTMWIPGIKLKLWQQAPLPDLASPSTNFW